MRLLVAEDDVALRSVLERGLRESGYVVDAVSDGVEALSYLRAYDYEVAVLDWRMPRLSGLEVVQELRRKGSSLPVLMLTARDMVSDRVTGLDEGADDYLVKPFDLAELQARLRAVLRRPGARSGVALSLGDLTFDTISREARVDGRPLALRRRETLLLEALLAARGRLVVRDVLDERLYGYDQAVTPNALEASVSRLRRALEAAGAAVRLETRRGIGYLLRAKAEPA